jgi:hypothetical protein
VTDSVRVGYRACRDGARFIAGTIHGVKRTSGCFAWVMGVHVILRPYVFRMSPLRPAVVATGH